MKYPELQPGDRVGRWVLVDISHKRRGEAHWDCLCECGNTKAIAAGSLKRKASKSCGCLNAEVMTQRFTTHGKSNDPIFAIWNAMIQRCHNPNSKQWEDYGGRQIGVCPSWHVFENFYADMGDPPFKGAHLDRRRNEEGYSKDNCRWVTRTVNMNNTRFNQHVQVGNKQMTVSELVRLCGLKYTTVYQRIYRYNTPAAEVLKGSTMYPTPVLPLGTQADLATKEKLMTTAKKGGSGKGKGGGGKKGCVQP